MNHKQPLKISVITPCYNAGAHIKKAINTVLAQDNVTIEHIVIDGGSKDGTVDILNEYSHIIWRSEADKGQADAMNKGFALATGDYILYLNADDELSNGWLQHAVSLLTSSSADMVIGNLEIDRFGKREYHQPSTKLRDILNYRSFSFPLNPVSYLYKRSLQARVGAFPLDNHYTMDYWFLLRAYLRGKIFATDFLSGVFYIDGTNKTSNLNEALQSLANDKQGFLKEFWWHPHVQYIASVNQLKQIKSKLHRVFS